MVNSVAFKLHHEMNMASFIVAHYVDKFDLYSYQENEKAVFELLPMKRFLKVFRNYVVQGSTFFYFLFFFVTCFCHLYMFWLGM